MRVASLLVLFALAGCVGGGSWDEPEGKWETVALEHARCFTIERRGAERRLTVFGPGGRKDTLAIHRLGGNGDGVLPGVLDRIAVVSTTHLAYIEALGKVDAVVGAAHLDRLVSDGPRAVPYHRIPDIGTANGLDRERIIAIAPQALLDHPFGEGGATEPPGGVPRIFITEYLEEHPLGRAEWSRFMGVLLGCERQADSLYEAMAARYRQAVHAVGAPRPRVFFGSAWQGQWFVPPGNSYMATLIHDAGGDYVYADRAGGENIAVDLETVIDACGKAAHFGVVLAAEGPVDARRLTGDPRLALLPAVARGGFVGNSAVNDLFGQALLEPDVVLRDLHCIFHPEHCSGHEPRYFTPIAQ